MVRAITYFLLALCLLCSCNSTVKDIQRYQLHGDVERIEVYDSTATWKSICFNKDGMLDSIVIYSPQDTLRNIYVYDSKGLLTEIQVLHTDGKYEALHEYKYRRKTVSSYALRGIDMQVLYRWDFDICRNRQVNCRCYNEGILINRSEYTYDGLNKTETVYTPDGDLWNTTTYTYADPGRISSICSDGYEIRIEYKENGLPSISKNGIIGHDGEIYTNADSRKHGTIHYEYTIDDKGNWTERQELLGEAKVKGRTIRRKIIYR